MNKQTTKFVFIGGAPRSGTTMVQNILNSHSTIYGGPEFDWLPSLSHSYARIDESIGSGRLSSFCTREEFHHLFTSFLTDLFGISLSKAKKLIFSEKTPDNVLAFSRIQQIFPEAKFIFVLRDPRAILNSSLQVNKRAKRVSAQGGLGSNLTQLYNQIAKSITAGTHFHTTQPNSCYLLVYENLIQNPQTELQSLCDFLEIELEASMIENKPTQSITSVQNHSSTEAFITPSLLGTGFDQSRINSWQKELSFWQRKGCSRYFKKKKLKYLQRYGL